MLKNGQWRLEGIKGNVAGFHLSELYSPWVSWSRIVQEFLKAKLMPETLKTWVNTTLGETWEDAGDSVDETNLLTRTENWGNLIPKEIVIITAGVDVQNDRLEMEIVGWAIAEESWSLDYRVIYGDPGRCCMARFFRHCEKVLALLRGSKKMPYVIPAKAGIQKKNLR